MKLALALPKDGIEGLKENWRTDLLSGFMIFLLAMPLSLGIADQSKFPAAFGLVTAIIGGMLVSFFAGSRLTIKGPAAGLAPIVAGAVIGFSDDPVLGWKMACGAIVVAALLQILFGTLKLGSMSNFFPASAIHGMLAAIGILIFSKQIHNLLGIPGKALVDDNGKSLNPLGLITHIPQSIANADVQITIIGILSLAIVFGIPYLKNKWIKAVPIPMLVLLLAIPLAAYFGLNEARGYSMIKIGSIIDQVSNGIVGKNISFEGIKNTGVFIQYVLLFSLIGSIESLLTVKAIDGLDPYKRKSNYNKDLIAVGFGNLFSGFLGGLPMISEVARSSANVTNGAKTRWANFFHGLCLLAAVLLIIPILEMIPKTALAALLLGVAYRLAAPQHFINTFKIGKEQFAVFIVTIIVTIAEDLLIGVIAGITLEFILNIIYAQGIKNTFSVKTEVVKEEENKYTIFLKSALTFSNFHSFKKTIDTLPKNSYIKLDFSGCNFIDHGAIEQLRHLEEEIHEEGGTLFEFNKVHFVRMGSHRLSGLRDNALLSLDNSVLVPVHTNRQQLAVRLGYRFVEFAKNEIRDIFSKFYLYQKMKVVNAALVGKTTDAEYYIVDVVLEEQKGFVVNEIETSILLIQTQFAIPDFSLEIEDETSILTELNDANKDIDFDQHKDFSDYYLLRGSNEKEIRNFFNAQLIQYFENNKDFQVEVKDKTVLVRINATHLSNAEIVVALEYAKELILHLKASSIVQGRNLGIRRQETGISN